MNHPLQLPQEWMGDDSNEVEWNGFTKLYNQQVADLTQWFKVRLPSMPVLELTQEQRDIGIDALPDEYQTLMGEAFDLWGKERDYELSYNQCCIAFFAALDELKGRQT